MRLRIEGEGPPVVKIAGLVGGVELFQEGMRAARRGGFRVAALDTSGDRADDPASRPITWDSLTEEVIGAIDETSSRGAVVWGTSFGALVALAVAARRPDRVAGMLLSFPPRPGHCPRAYGRLFRWAQCRRHPDRAVGRMFRVGFLLLNAWEFALFPTAMRRFVELSRITTEAATPASTVRQKLILMWESHPGLPPSERPIPCSIIAAKWDTVTPPNGVRRLASELPDARVRWLSRAGHAGAFSRPATYASWAVEELRRLSRSGWCRTA